jgi:hypothetical protein
MKNKKEFYATQFEKLGFEKIPTEDGFTMFELDPSKLKEKSDLQKTLKEYDTGDKRRAELEDDYLNEQYKKEKPAASKPGLRIVEHVKWEGKDYALPFYGMDLDTDRNKMITIQNRFGGDSVTIPWFAAAVYDVIMGSEKLEQWDDHRKGIDWFAEHFPDAYMVLLD